MSKIEQTLSIIKPDAVERNLQDQIKSEFKNKGFEILKEKKIHITKEEAEKFYKVHESKPFYNDLCAYLSSGPIVVMILEGENAVKKNREIMGSTDPKMAAPNTYSMLQARKVLAYLQSTKDYKMVFDGNDDNPVIYGWADSSFNTGVGDRKSQYGYCFGFGLKSAMFINVCRSPPSTATPFRL